MSSQPSNHNGNILGLSDGRNHAGFGVYSVEIVRLHDLDKVAGFHGGWGKQPTKP